MIFLFDYGDEWRFLVECLDIVKPEAKKNIQISLREKVKLHHSILIVKTKSSVLFSLSHLLIFRLKILFFTLNYLLRIVIFYTESQLHNFLLKIYIKNRFLRYFDIFYECDRTLKTNTTEPDKGEDYTKLTTDETGVPGEDWLNKELEFLSRQGITNQPEPPFGSQYYYSL